MSLTYAQLKQKVQQWVQDFSSEFVTAFDDGLADAEFEISQAVNCDQMRFQGTINFVAGTYVYDKPAAAVAIRHISFLNGTSVQFMQMRRREWIMDYAPQPGVLAQRGVPKFWDNYDTLTTATGLVTSQIYIGKTPAAAYVATAECEGRIMGLTSSNTTTWLSVYQPNLLFAACMRRMVRHDKESDQAAIWDAEYVAGVQALTNEVMRQRSDATSEQRTA